MAIDYGTYVQQAGQGVDFSPLQQGIQNYMQKSDEAFAQGAQRFEEEAWASLMEPYQKASFKDGSTWNPSMFLNQNAGYALTQFKKDALAKGQRFYDKLSVQGAFNPLTFKQKFDQMRAAYMPTIEQKLEQFKSTNGWNDRQMQQWIGHNSGLQSFLLDFADPAGPIRELAKPYSPAGFLGGGVNKIMSDPLRYGMSLGGLGAIRGGIGGMKDWKDFRGFGKGAQAGLKGTYIPSYLKAGEFGKGKIPSLQSIAKDLKKTGYGSKFDKGAAHAKKRWGQKTSGAKRTRNAAFKKATGQKWDPNAKGKAKALQTRWSKADDWKGKTGGGGQAKTTRLSALKAKQAKAAKKTGEGALRSIQAMMKKHGKMGVIKVLAKKLGMKEAVKVAAKLAAGTALTGTGIGTAFGVAMNAWTLYDIAGILKEAFAETGISEYGLRNPAAMAFGGRPSDTTNIDTKLGSF